MGDFDGAIAAILLVCAVLGIILMALAFWFVAGYVCVTLDWMKYDYAQIWVYVVMLVMASTVVRK